MYFSVDDYTFSIPAGFNIICDFNNFNAVVSSAALKPSQEPTSAVLASVLINEMPKTPDLLPAIAPSSDVSKSPDVSPVTMSLPGVLKSALIIYELFNANFNYLINDYMERKVCGKELRLALPYIITL